MNKLFNKKFYLILALIFLTELFSLYGYLLPDFRQVAFFVIVILTLLLSLKDLKYGVLIVLAELFIGSKGYLFYFEHNGLILSIRVALWLVIMSVWLGGVVKKCITSERVAPEAPQACGASGAFSRIFNRNFFSFFILFLFIAWGVINGFLNNNEFSNIFFDFNGWLYFTLIFPIYKVGTESPQACGDSVPVSFLFLQDLIQVFTATILWLCFETFFLLFIFSHNISVILPSVYKWIRITGVGEITQMKGGFYRIFFQSHIFVLIGFFILLFWLSSKFLNPKELQKNSLFLIPCLSVILISLSRSFWVGLIVGLILYCFIILWLYGWKKLIKVCGILLISAVLSIGLIIIIVKFPYPSPLGGFNTAELLSERASKADEVAISSRWNLLPRLWTEIKKSPILGQGFGSAITYKSSDPRVLSSSVTGEYTTYAFEWGWLDIWLKLGFFGLLAYLALIGKIVYSGFKIMQNAKCKMQNNLVESSPYGIANIQQGLVVGLVVVVVVSIFSPYLNHPLGIGYMIIVSAFMQYSKLVDK